MTDQIESGGPTAVPPDDTSVPPATDSSPSTSSNAPATDEGEHDSLMSPDVEREVAEAMADMAPDDLAALVGTEVPSDAESIEPGTELTGTVAGVTDEDVFLEFGAKSQGVLPRTQFGKKEEIAVGRRVDVVVDRFDPDSGLLSVYRKGALQRATWTNLTKGMLVEGKVTGMNKGGLEIDLKGIRAFMPGSQVDLHPMKDISVLLGDTVRAEVIELDRRGKNVLVSRRKVLEREQAAAREKIKDEIEVGQTRTGVVGNITEYGAFVDLGGVDGLLHIRDLSWGTVEKVTDVVKPGQEIQVKILRIEKKRDRISLGLKQALPDPWTGIAERYAVGTSVKVRIVRIANFGAFAEVEAGVEGLIPISELDWSHVKSVEAALSVGEVIDAVIIRLEPERRRLALSRKQAKLDPWAGVLESFSAQSIVHGKVTRLADFGAFVEIAPGVEGMIHISELSDRRIKSCREVVDTGQEVDVRVLGVDQENRRIALSLKTATERTEVAPEGQEPLKKPKKRKKPLRGGLESHFDW